MKKFKTGLLAFALVLGVSGAFVSKIHAAPKVKTETYDWQHFDRNGNPLGDSESGKTVLEAQGDYGCSGDQAICAVGTNGPDTETIRYSN